MSVIWTGFVTGKKIYNILGRPSKAFLRVSILGLVIWNGVKKWNGLEKKDIMLL